MPETSSILVSDLLIDAENPRLPQPNVGQREALRSIASHQGQKLQRLASDILENGLNPADLSIVMPFKDDLKRYVVLEGNRRLTALRALENPEFLVDAISSGILSAIRRLSRQYQDAPIESMQCVVVKDREEARHWIELRHTGENEGAGIVPWGSDDKARFRSRTGALELHSQALNFLESRRDLTPESRRQVPVTSFKRLIETPEVRAKLGVESQSGTLALLADAKQVAKALMHVVRDLADGKTKVGDIYTKAQRVKYANDLPNNVTVTPTLSSGHGVPVGSSGAVQAKSKAASAKMGRHRDKLIPRDCALNVSDPRLRDIEHELRKLSLSEHTNAVSVLFRVFIELSADAYIDSKGLAGVSADDKLSKKLQTVTNDLVTRNKLSGQQAKPVRRACARDSFLAPSIDLMHNYIHNQYIFPAPAISERIGTVSSRLLSRSGHLSGSGQEPKNHIQSRKRCPTTRPYVIQVESDDSPRSLNPFSTKTD